MARPQLRSRDAMIASREVAIGAIARDATTRVRTRAAVIRLPRAGEGRIEPVLDVPDATALDLRPRREAVAAAGSRSGRGLILSLVLHGLIGLGLLLAPAPPSDSAGETAISVTLMAADAPVGQAEADSLAGPAAAPDPAPAVMAEPALHPASEPAELDRQPPDAVAAMGAPEPAATDAVLVPAAAETRPDPDVPPEPELPRPEAADAAPLTAPVPQALAVSDNYPLSLAAKAEEMPAPAAVPDAVPPPAVTTEAVEAPVPPPPSEPAAPAIADPVPPPVHAETPVQAKAADLPLSAPVPVAGPVPPRITAVHPVAKPQPRENRVADAPASPARKPVGTPPRKAAAAPGSPAKSEAPAVRPGQRDDGGQDQASAMAGRTERGGAAGDAAAAFASWSARVRAAVRAARVATGDLDGAEPPRPALVQFSISRSGALVSASLARSCGQPAFDAVALAKVRRAGPFPPVPDTSPAPQTLTIPVALSFD